MNVANLGWAVSIPAGDATAYVEVDGKVISFNYGSGYHDHVRTAICNQTVILTCIQELGTRSRKFQILVRRPRHGRPILLHRCDGDSRHR